MKEKTSQPDTQNIRYKVLCIGINSASGGKNRELEYAKKDAHAVSEYFKTLKDDASVTLLDGQKATKEAVVNWCRQCNAITQPLTVVVFAAGHITTLEQENKLYRCVETADSEEAGNLKIEELLELLNNTSHKLLLILNAVYSFPPGHSVTGAFRELHAGERIDKLKEYAVISSSATAKPELEDAGLRHGVLTHYFLWAISGQYSFFLRKRIALARLLQLLDKKVKNHRFTFKSGRKRPSRSLKETGVPVHFIGKSQHLPILEPRPFLSGGRLRHFLTASRLRKRLFQLACAALLIALVFLLAQVLLVRVHFIPYENAVVRTGLTGEPGIPLNGLNSENIGGHRSREYRLNLFRANWVNALVPKLDEKGKIFLLGYLLGKPMNGIDAKQLLVQALISEEMFYWQREDIYRTMRELTGQFEKFNKLGKKKAMQLLVYLGKPVASTAKRIIRFQKEKDQDLRNLFLEHFYSVDFLERNIDHMNHKDYLTLLNTGASIPPGFEKRLMEKAERFLSTVSGDIPVKNLPLANDKPLWAVYDKLQILAQYGSSDFREKAAIVFNKAFEPGSVYSLAFYSRKNSDRLWVLEQYFQKIDKRLPPNKDISWWWKFFRNFVWHVPDEYRNAILKLLIDNDVLHRAPETYLRGLFSRLQRADVPGLTLERWEKWLQKNQMEPNLVFYSVIGVGYEDIFPFLSRHYERFNGFFNELALIRLAEFKDSQTVTLAKKLYESGGERDRLHAALFLCNKKYREYAPIIIGTLRKAEGDAAARRLLGKVHGDITGTVMRLMENDPGLQRQLQPVLLHPEMMRMFFKINMHFWPQEVIARIKSLEIPASYREGIRLLMMSKRLPEPHREDMLVKFFNAELEEGFRYYAESALASQYPGRFLELVFNKKYRWRRRTGTRVKEAYKSLTVKALSGKLAIHLSKGAYKKAGFICDVLVEKGAKDPDSFDSLELLHVLEQHDDPLERIILRKLRHYLNKRQFMEDTP